MGERRDYVGAVDIGGTKIEVGIISRDGSVLSRQSLPTKSVVPGKAGAMAIAGALQQCQRQCGYVIASVGIGCTGPVDPLTGIIGNVALLPGWQGYNLVGELASLLNIAVSMENDADAAALAESLWGRGRGAERFLYVTVSTGLGTGFLCNGEIYRGARGAHPEMGHHSIDPAGPQCYCGMHGCWESLASGTALENWHAARWNLAEPLGAQTIFERAASGDPLAVETVERCVGYLGRGLANLVTMLVPDRIALGGGVMRSMAPYLPSIRKFVLRACGEVPAADTTIEIAALEQDAALVGAGAVGATWLPPSEETQI